MHSIDLPLTRCMRLLAVAIVAAPVILVGVSPIVIVWRLPALLVMLLMGILLWRRYRQSRPATLHVGTDKGLSCTLASGMRVEVGQVLPGIVAPRLVMATLLGRNGEVMSLVVPGRSLHADAHWHLRRALLAWRRDGGGKSGRPSRSVD